MLAPYLVSKRMSHTIFLIQENRAIFNFISARIIQSGGLFIFIKSSVSLNVNKGSVLLMVNKSSVSLNVNK